MKKDFKFLKPLGILFIILIICYKCFKNTNEYIQEFFMTLTGTIGFLFVVFFLVFVIQYSTEIFGGILGGFERKVKQLDKSDLKNNKEYYREILKINSPLVIGYMDSFELNKNKVIAELLYLKMRNLIIVEDGIIRKSNAENEHLLKSEKLIIDSILCDKFIINDYDSFLDRLKNLVISEAEELSLLEKEKKRKNRNKKIKEINWRKIIDKYLRNNYFCTYFVI